MKRRIGKGIALAFVAMVVCRAEVVAQGNPWNNPVVSPRVDTGGEVTFSVSAPSASRVELSGQFMEGTCPMRKGTDGVWSVTVRIDRPDIYPYSFRIDGVETSDPSNPLIFPNERFKASLLEIRIRLPSMRAIKMFRGDSTLLQLLFRGFARRSYDVGLYASGL